MLRALSELPRARSLRPRALSAVRIFLCHSSSDKPAVRQLYNRLLTDGFRPWLDEEDLLPGQDWNLEIGRAIRASEVVLVCLSKESVSRTGYVQREIREVLDAADARPEGALFVVPARLESCPIPERLAKWNCVDLHRKDGYRRLRAALRKADQDMQDEDAKEAQMSSGAPIRFDGVYITETGEARTYLRFFKAGIVCTTTSSIVNVDEAAKFLWPTNPDIANGTFIFDDDRIEVEINADDGLMEYSGVASQDGSQLHLYGRAGVSDSETFAIWRFTRVLD